MGLKENLEKESVSSLPIRDAIPLERSTVVRAAVEQMRSKHLGCAVIVDAGKPVGIFTERSLLDLLVQGRSLDDCQVGDYPDPHYLEVKSSDPVSRVWEAILRDGRRFICVLDNDGRLVGLTGQRGMAEYVSEYFPQQVMVQRLGSKPQMQQREGA